VQFAGDIEAALGGEGSPEADEFRVAFARATGAGDSGEDVQNALGFGPNRAERAINEVLAIAARSRIRAIQAAAEAEGISIPGSSFRGLFSTDETAPDLSQDQRDRVLALKSRYETQRAAIERRWAPELRQDTEAVLDIGSSEGSVRLGRVEPEDESPEGIVETEVSFVVMSGSGTLQGGGRDVPQGFRDDVAALEQSVIEQLRSILTIDQRAVIANY